MNLNGFSFLVGYVALFFGTLCCVIWWDRRKKRTRHPLGNDIKLLRMPGEYLWRRVLRSDEADLPVFFAMALIPSSTLVLALQFTLRFFPSFLSEDLVASVMVFAFSLLLCARWWQRRWQRRANDYLGFFGERYVAEILDPLKAQGWFIFHDIQCVGANGNFNLDHVAIGPGGIWVVETKTRRKWSARPDDKDHKVVFDGIQIIGAWGNETKAIFQALRNARWLEEWLKKMTGKPFQVWAVVTFPGYYVTESKLGQVRVVNPNGLSGVLISRGKDVLRAEDIDLIQRQIDAKGRDVEF